MNDPIVFTPSDVISIVSSIAGLLIAINAAALVLIGWYRKAHKPEEIQNQRITDLEARCEKVERSVQDMKNEFELSRASIRAIEEDNRAFQKVVVKGIQALTEHALNGDGSEALHQSSEAINDYLLNGREVKSK